MTPNEGGRKYAMKGKQYKDIYVHTIIMIDPASCWVELLYSLPGARADLVANQVDLTLLTRNPFSRQR